MSLDYVVSADSHIFEPLDLWEKALGDKWGDKVPRLVTECEGVPGNFFFLDPFTEDVKHRMPAREDHPSLCWC